jgi:hypothetical protein
MLFGIFNKSFLLFFLALLQLNPAIASDKPSLSWAGFAFLGDFDQRDIRYPYTSEIALESKNQQSSIDKTIFTLVRGFNSEKFQLDTSMAKNSDSLSAGLGIAYEDIYKIKTGSKYKVSYEIGLNFIVFDFQERKIIAIYPMKFLRNEIYNKEPTKEDHKKIFKNLYTGNEFNILEKSLKRISNVQIKEAMGNYLGVSHIEFTKNSKEDVLNSLEIDSIKTSIAQEFEGLLSVNNQVPLVPYTKGEIIGKDMAVRFSDRSQMTFALPDLDYNISILVRGFDFKVTKHHYGYTIKITILASDDLHPKLVVLNLSKNIWVLKRGSGNIEDESSQWIVYKEALSILLQELTQQINNISKTWLKKHSTNKDATLQLQNLQKLINKSK